MANVRLVFNGDAKTTTSEHELEVFCTTENTIFISLSDDDYIPKCIHLDKQTAIKFHKELKKQISYIREEGKNE